MASTAFWVGLAFACIFVFDLGISGAVAQDCRPAGRLFSIEGHVEVRRDPSLWQPVSLNQSLCEKDVIRTGSRSRAAIRLANDAVLRLDQNTTLVLVDVTTEKKKRTLLDLIRGAIQSLSRWPNLIDVKTPYLNASIEGTEFALLAAPRHSRLTVFEGTVSASNPYGRLRVTGGQSAAASAGEPPRYSVLVRPRDAVQWALYYPPVLASTGSGATSDSGEPKASRLGRAAALLSVGRGQAAQSFIQQALDEGRQVGLAYALRAIVALVQDNKDQALVDARRGVALEPTSAAPRIALSYALQARFELQAARDTLLEATKVQPHDPLVWARLAELWLMLGYRDAARTAALRAAEAAPSLERVHVVMGFIALTESRMADARQDFTRAIELDPADPQPWFGLGLAIIRDGNLQGGRRNLEMALGLNSSNSLLRSYLGKAYSEERRAPLDAKLLETAKRYDPLDPTPYLYDALRKQSENDPVGALAEMQSSIDRNDNRAVYRSREALDQDRGTRGASLARIFDDLGFEQVGINRASASLSVDPAGASAHRFLSDIYAGARRHEIARVSELYQAQMLQDININPVQPSLSDTNLGIATRGGPSKPGFNEFTPLFERNDVQVIGAGIVGTNDTAGYEGVASAIYNQTSVSAGTFRFTTDGWRPNNGISHDIDNFFLQTAVTPDFNMQLELRHRATENGDLAFNFDPASFNPDYKRTLDQDFYRIGARYSLTPHSDLLASVSRGVRKEQVDQYPDSVLPGFETLSDGSTSQTEAQYILRGERANFVAGLSYTTEEETVRFEDPFFPLLMDRDSTHFHAYSYANLQFPERVVWTLGAAYDEFERAPIEVQGLSPKLGVRWNVSDDLTLRAAAFRWVKPLLSSDRSLEPTQVAGFNQLFDDLTGDDSWRYGAAADWRITTSLFAGTELTWRHIDVPLQSGATAAFEPWKEELHRAYVDWAITPRISLSAQATYDIFEAKQGSILATYLGTPLNLQTFSVPLQVRYFDPSGFFAGLSLTYVQQQLERSDFAKLPQQMGGLGLSDGSDTFSVVDLVFGWRLPRRTGIASVSINNLFDETFQYQDDSFREFRDEPATGPYTPGISVTGRVTLDLTALHP